MRGGNADYTVVLPRRHGVKCSFRTTWAQERWPPFNYQNVRQLAMVAAAATGCNQPSATNPLLILVRHKWTAAPTCRDIIAGDARQLEASASTAAASVNALGAQILQEGSLARRQRRWQIHGRPHSAGELLKQLGLANSKQRYDR
jgi:hypothetical protein